VHLPASDGICHHCAIRGKHVTTIGKLFGASDSRCRAAVRRGPRTPRPLSRRRRPPRPRASANALTEESACKANDTCRWVAALMDDKTGKQKRKAYCRNPLQVCQEEECRSGEEVSLACCCPSSAAGRGGAARCSEPNARHQATANRLRRGRPTWFPRDPSRTDATNTPASTGSALPRDEQRAAPTHCPRVRGARLAEVGLPPALSRSYDRSAPAISAGVAAWPQKIERHALGRRKPRAPRWRYEVPTFLPDGRPSFGSSLS